MKERTYEVEVVFSTSIFVSVTAEDVDEAMDLAEYEAAKKFEDKLYSNALETSDFDYEAQTP